MCEALCGNGVVDPGENCENCEADASCPGNMICVNGQCECPWDIDGDGFVGINDFLAVIEAWGPCP